MRAGDIMNREVLTLKVSQTLGEAAELFAGRGISGAPVVDDKGNLAGIITEADILGVLKERYTQYNIVYPTFLILPTVTVQKSLKEMEMEEVFREVYGIKIETVMKKRVFTAAPDEPVQEVAATMLKERINRMPVVEGKRVVGIVTRGDIMRGLFGKR